jgi:hypothetical protein
MLSLGAVGLASLAGVSAARANLATFDDLGLNPLDDITTQYSGIGVTFKGITDAGGQVNVEVSGNSVFPDNNPVSAPLSLSNFYDHNGYNRAHIIQILFSSAASGISFYYDGAGSGGAQTVFNVYDTFHTLLSSFSVASATDGNYHYVSVGDSNVGEIDVVNAYSGWGHYIDNIQFTQSGNNAPDVASTGALFAGSMTILGFLRRKLA